MTKIAAAMKTLGWGWALWLYAVNGHPQRRDELRNVSSRTECLIHLKVGSRDEIK
jgi:hypothetical protein